MEPEKGHNQIMFSLGKIEQAQINTNEHLAKLNHRTEKNEDRISALESYKDGVAMKVGFFGLIGGGIITAFWESIKSKLFNL